MKKEIDAIAKEYDDFTTSSDELENLYDNIMCRYNTLSQFEPTEEEIIKIQENAIEFNEKTKATAKTYYDEGYTWKNAYKIDTLRNLIDNSIVFISWDHCIY